MFIKGTIVDGNTLTPIQKVKIEGGDDVVYTDSNGNFIIDGDKVKELSISIKGYSPIVKVPYGGDGKLKEELGVIELTPNPNKLSIEKIESTQLDTDLIKQLSSQGFSTSAIQQKIINKSISKIKVLLIPFILTLLAKFGITNGLDKLKDPSTLLNPSCPDLESLKDAINKRNKLVKQLNSLYKVVDTTFNILSVAEGLLLTLEGALLALKFLPIPTPPPPAPSLVPPIQDIKPVIQKEIDKYQAINTGILIILSILRDALQQALDLLSILDQQIAACSEGSDNLVAISDELRNINNENLNNPTTQQVVEVNGFNFGIETESTTNDLKRKRAIAKNSQGVILLRGEYSYSSSDQILIDELVFYIQTNDLKAN